MSFQSSGVCDGGVRVYVCVCVCVCVCVGGGGGIHPFLSSTDHQEKIV